ncbi:pimeloyl-ACP methyl ester carboxylesterase [Crossiella equi]|uniref:Pimeloyl-ACP methyl ester carboxylesterase n=1 Tax=Crossiella equi TaxID=130796 RepID=A0ABS5AFI2_9PSEU|nr:alpha/beta hydrolase [Crossiella equi]MBP2475333.1 pimeloyl-ACP methyl ester carboxylesterase [Crossiella equi]
MRGVLAVVVAALLATPVVPVQAAPRLAWTPCAQDATADCATLRLPLVDLAVTRRRATRPQQRIGVLVLNPGGPGASGANFALDANRLFSPDVLARYDLVGFDPRGIAGSSPIRCSTEVLDRKPRELPRTEAEFQGLVAYNRELRADCRARSGPLFDRVGTREVAADLDALRRALGESKISFFGVSYGTLIGQQYAERYGDHVRGMVLDSVMDHSLDMTALAATAAAAAEDSLHEFARWCTGDTTCALHGRDVLAFWRDALAASDRGELLEFGEIPIGDRYVISRAYGAFARVDYPSFATWLSQLKIGKPAAAPGPRSTAAPSEGTQPNGRTAVFCQDWQLRPGNLAELNRVVAAERAAAPLMRYSPELREALLDCVGWPPATNPQRPARVTRGPVLQLVGARHDPTTGYAWAQGLARQLGPRAALHTYEGAGHGVYHRGACNRAAVDTYLLTGVPGTASCPASG